MRQLYAYVANESTRRLVQDGMSTGLTNTLTAHGSWILCSVSRVRLSVGSGSSAIDFLVAFSVQSRAS